ncbi:MAG: STAS domain-containing protein [Bacteroidetes bacterium]|nr:STAS domain-containing protein [Bacteroidota bacterium]
MELNTSITDISNKFSLLRLTGDVDAYFNSKLKTVLNKAIKSREGDLLVDLENVEFIDSVGAGILVSALNKIQKKKRDLILVYSNKSRVFKFLKFTEIDKKFTVYTTIQMAYDKLKIKSSKAESKLDEKVS